MTNNRWTATLTFFSCTERIDIIIRSSTHWWLTVNIFVFIHNLSILHLSWSFPPFSSFAMRAWHPNDKNDSWSRLSSEGTYTDSFTPISCHLPHLTSSISQTTHRALHTHKEQACQREHSLVWQREGQMAFNHTSSSGHLISSFVCVVETPTDRPPNSSNTPPLRVNGVHSSHCLVQPMTKHDTAPTHPEWPLLCPLLVSSHPCLH